MSPPRNLGLLCSAGAARRVSYIDHLSIDAPQLNGPGDTGTVVVRALNRQGQSLPLGELRLVVVDPAYLRIAGPTRQSDADPLAAKIPIQALSRGLARFAASAGNWRADTAFIPVGDESLTLLTDGFDDGLSLSRWHPLGVPSSTVKNAVGKTGSPGLVSRSDREWESGVLSGTVFPIRDGLSIHAWVKAPLGVPAAAAKSFAIALVAADPSEVLDPVAPKFLRLATLSWLGPAGRLSYEVGREIFTEPVARIGVGDAHEMEIEIDADSRVSFYIDGVNRWTSTLRVRTVGDNSRAQLWLGTRASGDDIVFDDIAISLKMRPTRR